MSIEQFRLPDLGEGLTEGDILAWTVAVGDTVAVNDTIAEVETVKAAVELPSPFAGVVAALHAAAGETVPVGTPIISIEVGEAAPVAADSEPPADDVQQPRGDLVPTVPEQPLTLVGYGPRAEGTGRRRRRLTAAPAPGPDSAANAGRHAVAAPVSATPSAQATARVLATPPVRKLAKTLGVDLAAVPPTGRQGSVSRADVHAAAAAPAAPATPAAGRHETRIPVRGVRKHTAAAMVSSAFTAPHVTEFLTVDLTATMELRDRVGASRGVRISPLAFVAKAALLAIRDTPEVNATWDDAAGEIVLKHYVDLGIAAATPRGLVVPAIRDAGLLALPDLAAAIAELAETARAGRTTPAELSGSTFTITNVGVFGVDSGTPILNPGESAILAFGAVRRMPWVVGSGADERLEPRWVTQLALSFDHRIVDGEQGSRFLAQLGALLTDPALALLR